MHISWYATKGPMHAAGSASSFILPKKPASLLKNILPREENKVVLEFDDRNASFTLTNYKLVCRLVEGNYPSYNSVIPTNNPYQDEHRPACPFTIP